MKPIYFLLIVFAFTISVFSCKKDKVTPAEMLTANPWKASTVTDNGVLQTIPACSLDDVVTYLSNGTYSYNPGAVKCDTETTRTGTWSLSGDGKILTMDGTPASVEISEKKLVMTLVIGTHTIVTTFAPA